MPPDRHVTLVQVLLGIVKVADIPPDQVLRLEREYVVHEREGRKLGRETFRAYYPWVFAEARRVGRELSDLDVDFLRALTQDGYPSFRMLDFRRDLAGVADARGFDEVVAAGLRRAMEDPSTWVARQARAGELWPPWLSLESDDTPDAAAALAGRGITRDLLAEANPGMAEWVRALSDDQLLAVVTRPRGNTDN